MSATHCAFCAEPWRAVLIRLAATPLASHLISRHYGIHKSTVVKLVRDARERGCLGPRTCWVCGEAISTRRIICGNRECRRKDELVRSRRRRAHFGRSEVRRVKYGHHRRAPPNFVWPTLPPNPRLRTPLVPREVNYGPLLHPETLFGLGNRKAEVRGKARLAAGAMPVPGMPVIPWQGGVAPPKCPTLGSLVYGRMAA